MIYGVDCSHHNGDPDWVAVYRDGIRFVVLKVTEGTSYNWQDWLTRNAAAASRAGLLVAGYGFMHDQDGAAQADYYADRAAACGVTGGHAADTETAPGPDYPTATQTGAFCARVKTRTGAAAGCYSGYWYWVGVLGNPALPGSVDYYWDSRYVANGTVRPWRTIVDEVPSAWFTDRRTGGRAPTIIQVNSNALVAGISGGVDLDVFPGTIDELRALLQGVEDDVSYDDAVRALRDVLRLPANGLAVPRGQVDNGNLAAILVGLAQQNVNAMNALGGDVDRLFANLTAVSTKVDTIVPEVDAQTQRVLDKIALIDFSPMTDAQVEQIITGLTGRLGVDYDKIAALVHFNVTIGQAPVNPT